MKRVRTVWWSSLAALLLTTSTTAAEPVRVTLTGACPAADLAERTARELRLVGFEPTVGGEANAELHIRRNCGGGFTILIRDRLSGKVLREEMQDAPTEEVVLHAVELLRAVTAAHVQDTSAFELAPDGAADDTGPDDTGPDDAAEACDTPLTIELTQRPELDSALEAWDANRGRRAHRLCLDACRDNGRCSRIDDSCIAASDQACFWSMGCRDHGRCRAVAGQCLATQDRDCRRSRACRERGLCSADVEEHKCVDNRPRRSPSLMAGGIVGVSLSGAAVLGGVAYLYVAGAQRSFKGPDGTNSPLPGIMLMTGGGIGLATSLTGLVYGAQRISPEEERLRDMPPPLVSLWPGGATVTLRF